jgi:hypothetical protein
MYVPASHVLAATTSFHIGNSFTVDATVHNGGLSALMPDNTSGYLIRTGSPLHVVLSGIGGGTESTSGHGSGVSALENYDWDYVTMQPHYSQGSTLGQDIDSILSIINAARSRPTNDGTVFYVYQTWPRQGLWPYEDEWTSPVVDSLDTPTVMRRDYYHLLLSRLGEQTDAVIRLIPTGEVFYQLNQRYSGNLDDFYRDDKHLSYADGLGRYTSALTMATVLSQESPINKSPTSQHYTGPNNPETVSLINQTVWDVVSSLPQTGLADFDDDGFVNSVDLDLWKSGSALADANGDDVSDGTDFLIWQRQITQVALTSSVVPEPSSVALLLLMFCILGASQIHRRGRDEASGTEYGS